MGLDMFLFKRSGADQKFKEVAYWRKANQVHNWFVTNCQNGIDECQETRVTKENLIDLKETCQAVLSTSESDRVETAKRTLPTVGGFFFGGTEYNEYYFGDLEDTVKMLEKVIDETDFEKEEIYYTSSW